MKLSYPLSKIFITQQFGDRPGVYKPYKGHTGIDFRTIFPDSPDGKRPVLAAAVGKVIEVGDQGTSGYGRFVRLEHTDGSQTVYGHLETWQVTKGQAVNVGDTLGISDSTGFSSAPHLHFGYRPAQYDYHNGYAGYVDPLPFFEKNTTSSESQQLKASPLSLMKQKNKPAIYIFGYDGLWHGLSDMDVLKTLNGPLEPEKVLEVDELPSNIGYEIQKPAELNQ